MYVKATRCIEVHRSTEVGVFAFWWLEMDELVRELTRPMSETCDFSGIGGGLFLLAEAEVLLVLQGEELMDMWSVLDTDLFFSRVSLEEYLPPGVTQLSCLGRVGVDCLVDEGSSLDVIRLTEDLKTDNFGLFTFTEASLIDVEHTCNKSN